MSKLNENIEMLKNDGEERDIKIVGYWKYSFNISFKTDNYEVELSCGGDPGNIYKFDPFGGWDEWEYVEISYLNYKKLTSAESPNEDLLHTF